VITLQIIEGLFLSFETTLTEGKAMEELLKRTWWNEKEVSQFTGLAISTLRNQRFYRRGFPYYLIGSAIRYKSAEIQEIIERSRIQFDGDR
jgi:hypothetical protein